MALYGAALTAAAAGSMVALERALGWSRQLRLTPLNPVAYIVIKAIVALAMGALAIAAVNVAGILQGKAEMPTSVWILSAVVTLFCTLTFAALGVFVGYIVPGENAMQILGPGLALLVVPRRRVHPASTTTPRSCATSPTGRRCTASPRSPAHPSPTSCRGTPSSTRSAGS